MKLKIKDGQHQNRKFFFFHVYVIEWLIITQAVQATLFLLNLFPFPSPHNARSQMKRWEPLHVSLNHSWNLTSVFHPKTAPPHILFLVFFLSVFLYLQVCVCHDLHWNFSCVCLCASSDKQSIPSEPDRSPNVTFRCLSQQSCCYRQQEWGRNQSEGWKTVFSQADSQGLTVSWANAAQRLKIGAQTCGIPSVKGWKL